MRAIGETCGAVYDVFASMPPGSRRTLDSRTLYRQWKETRLRRDDLASAIQTLVAAGILRYEWVDGECVFSLARGSARRPLRMLQGMVRRNPASSGAFASSHSRRREDHAQSVTGSERGSPMRSRLLNLLPVAEREKLYRAIELVPLRANAVLCGRNESLKHVYFPLDGIISCELEMSEGASMEVAAIANGGAAGLPVVGGESRSPFRLLVAHGGYAHRLPVAALLEVTGNGGPIERLMNRYERLLLQQVAWGAVCNRHHSVEQQVCRLLLYRTQGIGSSQLEITHEAIARALGVRREGVTQVLGRLQARGLLTCERGSITLADRTTLESLACECYTVIGQLHDALKAECGAGAGVATPQSPGLTACNGGPHTTTRLPPATRA